MIAKLGQGSSNMLQMQTTSDSDLASPSGPVTPTFHSPAFPRNDRRRSSASSIMSVESDSDEESGSAFPTLNPRLRSDSALTFASSTQSSESRSKDGSAEDKDELVRRQSETDIMLPEEEEALAAAITAQQRSESLSKVSRSSSAPQKERPRVVESSSLSRSSSAPQGPTPCLREGILMKRRGPEEQEGSVSSSSASLNDSAVDSDVPSPSPFQTSSIDFPSLPPPEPQETDTRSEPQSYSELESSTEQDPHQLSSSPDETISLPMRDNDCENFEPDQVPEENSLDRSEDDLSKGNLPVLQLGETAGFQALQSLSDSLESSLKGNGPTKQTPHIKSHLIAQYKIQSAITPPEPPRKGASLPRRSSPVVSQKPRPENLLRSQDKSDTDLNGILRKIRDASAATNASTGESSPSGSLERGNKLGKISKRASSETSRSPVKPDKSHYPVSSSLDLAEPVAKSDSKKERSSQPGTGSMLSSRKKSMSLTDLLNIGKDLTNYRSRDKDSDKDKNHRQAVEPLSPLSPLTDEETVSPTDGKKEEKKSRFSRLRRKSSRAELKDGIASGPNIDPKRASRHFFKESLMLESS